MEQRNRWHVRRLRDHRRWGALLVGCGAMMLLVACGGGEPELTGTDLDKRPSPDFTLTDHRGETVSLSDFRGKAVALTFIFTNCPDICPLTAEQLRAAYERLPDETRDNVALIAVTVDPERDDELALRAFSERHGLGDNPNWYALRGDRETLASVWRAYGINSGSPLIPSDHDHQHGSTGAGASTPAPAEMLAHTDAIYVIDGEGRQRVLLRSSFDPEAMADNLKALAG